ncbi:hypothetical protein CP49_12615 [Bradyrhizobium valentinum]|uniref:Uncharacterized protein n=1 Tax=Bradyrhizobium valentinum TaxID=1518501 RepID=A0A0R3L7R9_9BRAD|nr:hypothetical protein CP49_12615 [Bradyrhizobium valentinum]
MRGYPVRRGLSVQSLLPLEYFAETVVASWFDRRCKHRPRTRGVAALLTMRVSDLILRRRESAVSKDAGLALSTSLRANGSRECAPDDRLREAIHRAACGDMDCFVAFAPRNDGGYSFAFSRR